MLMLEDFNIYVINLPTREDRRREMTTQLKRLGLGFQSSNVRLFPAARPEGPGPFPSVGARGCFLSHLGVLEDAERRGNARILILEDDLNFSSDFPARWPRVLRLLTAEPWSMFYGGYEIGEDVVTLGQQPLIRYPAESWVQTAHFVGFQGSAVGLAAAFLREMLAREPGSPSGGPMHVDGAYCWFRRAHPEFQTWLAVPPLGYQRASKTDIHELRWLDQTPLLRRCVVIARRIRNLLAR